LRGIHFPHFGGELGFSFSNLFKVISVVKGLKIFGNDMFNLSN